LTRAKRGPRSNADWSNETISTLLQRARPEFAQRGYAEASVERIAEDAKLTKGAIYYHFGNKEGLFEAVLRHVQRDLVERIEHRAKAGASSATGIVNGCLAFLEVALDDELRRIALVDGPSTLGWSKWRAIDGEFGLGSLKAGLWACKAEGSLNHDDPDTLAHLISGALNEAVFLIAEADNRVEAHARVTKSLSSWLSSLFSALPTEAPAP
jgi:AcrR family transcriptional regulator